VNISGITDKAEPFVANDASVEKLFPGTAGDGEGYPGLSQC
jgi:hypothetical protein